MKTTFVLDTQVLLFDSPRNRDEVGKCWSVDGRVITRSANISVTRNICRKGIVQQQSSCLHLGLLATLLLGCQAVTWMSLRITWNGSILVLRAIWSSLFVEYLSGCYLVFVPSHLKTRTHNGFSDKENGAADEIRISVLCCAFDCSAVASFCVKTYVV